MTQEEIEKAWALMSMHNSELLLRVAELEKQLERRSIWIRIGNVFKYKRSTHHPYPHSVGEKTHGQASLQLTRTSRAATRPD